MAVIGILASIIVVNFANINDRDVVLEKERLISFLHQVQNRALTGDISGISLASSQRLCGFGARYDSNSEKVIVKYYYVSGLDLKCPSGFSSGVLEGTVSEEQFVPDEKKKVKISGFSKEIIFSVPDGRVWCSGGCPTITLTKGSSGTQIKIESGGEIR